MGAARGRRLTNAAYRTLGGDAGAIGRGAEVVYAGLQQEQQDAGPQLFGRLVQVMDINEEGKRHLPTRPPR